MKDALIISLKRTHGYEGRFCFDSNGNFIFKLCNRGEGPEEYLYKIDEPASLLRRQKKGLFSSDLNKLVDEMNEFDNPVIVKIKLK